MITAGVESAQYKVQAVGARVASDDGHAELQPLIEYWVGDTADGATTVSWTGGGPLVNQAVAGAPSAACHPALPQARLGYVDDADIDQAAVVGPVIVGISEV